MTRAMTTRTVSERGVLPIAGALVFLLLPGVARAEDGWQAFQEVASVLQSPRCLSCHISGDAPLQADATRPHGMNIKRGADGSGTPAQRCSNCHQDRNAEVRHSPPGAPGWRLPPPAMRMAWQGLKARELCAALVDPTRNGGKDVAALEEHVNHDPLVLWGWNPGPGRKPPPISHAAFVARFATWTAAGTPCGPARRLGKGGTGHLGERRR